MYFKNILHALQSYIASTYPSPVGRNDLVPLQKEEFSIFSSVFWMLMCLVTHTRKGVCFVSTSIIGNLLLMLKEVGLLFSCVCLLLSPVLEIFQWDEISFSCLLENRFSLSEGIWRYLQHLSTWQPSLWKQKQWYVVKLMYTFVTCFFSSLQSSATRSSNEN